MNALVPWGLVLALFIASWAMTGRVLRYALATRLLDVPNARSSHKVATPRGGGVAIVAMVLLALPLLGAFGVLSWRSVCAIVGGGAIVGMIGFADDHRDVPAGWRLLCQFAAAIWTTAWLGGTPTITALGLRLPEGSLGFILAVIYLVWLSNLFNFMDGIDGIAGVEALTVCAGSAAIAFVAVRWGDLWIAPVVVAAATLGFLVWNWPPARIFMGDVGSGFLGVIIGALSIVAAQTEPRLLWSWLILLGVFIVDATITLFRRIARRERFYQAHRSHAYQHASLRCGGHLPVTIAVAAINVMWLFPIALLAGLGYVDGFGAVLIAYAPLACLAIALDAGSPNPAGAHH